MLTILAFKYLRTDRNGQVTSFKDAIIICLLLSADLLITIAVAHSLGIEL
jgi:hypothetical protein